MKYSLELIRSFEYMMSPNLTCYACRKVIDKGSDDPKTWNSYLNDVLRSDVRKVTDGGSFQLPEGDYDPMRVNYHYSIQIDCVKMKEHGIDTVNSLIFVLNNDPVAYCNINDGSFNTTDFKYYELDFGITTDSESIVATTIIGTYYPNSVPSTSHATSHTNFESYTEDRKIRILNNMSPVIAPDPMFRYYAGLLYDNGVQHSFLLGWSSVKLEGVRGGRLISASDSCKLVLWTDTEISIREDVLSDTTTDQTTITPHGLDKVIAANSSHAYGILNGERVIVSLAVGSEGVYSLDPDAKIFLDPTGRFNQYIGNKCLDRKQNADHGADIADSQVIVAIYDRTRIYYDKNYPSELNIISSGYSGPLGLDWDDDMVISMISPTLIRFQLNDYDRIFDAESNKWMDILEALNTRLTNIRRTYMKLTDSHMIILGDTYGFSYDKSTNLITQI